MDKYRDFQRRSNPKDNKKYFNNVLYPVVNNSSNDVYIITREGDRLDLLAHEVYKDSSLWWILVKANPNLVRRDSFYIKPGIRLRIPTNVSDIKEKFRNLNKGR